MAQMALSRLFRKSIVDCFTKRCKINHIGFSSIAKEGYRTDKDFSLTNPNHKVPDVLLKNIRSANNSTQLFNIISNYNQVFNQTHVLQSLSAIHDIYKSKGLQISSRDLINDPAFERLCVGLKKYSRSLDLYEIIEALKVLSILDVPANTSIFQMLLQLIRANVNQLNLQQVVFLDFVLRKCDHNHLIDSLKLALPLVFQLNLTVQMDREDIQHSSDLLRYCSRNKIPQKFVTYIVTAAVLNDSLINKDTAKSIIWSLCDMHTPTDESQQVYSNLLHKCFRVLEKNMNSLDVETILTSLNKLKYKIVDKQLEFYDEDFLFACGNFVIQQNVEFTKALRVAKHMSRIAYTHIPLLEYISQIAISSPNLLADCRPSVLFGFVNALSNGNFKPEYWDQIEHQIFKNPLLRSTKTELPWTKFSVELATLDSFNDHLLNMVFSGDFLENYLSRENCTLDYIQLLTLYQSVTLFHTSYEGNIPPQKYLNKAIEITSSKEVDNILHTALEKAFGGPEYVASRVIMPNGFFVDFLVTFREGHYPIAINLESTQGGPTRYEDLHIDKNNEVICILNFHKGSYSLNAHRLRGNFSLSLRILEQMGYKVIPISTLQWMNLPGAERIPYIMREIDYKSHKNFDNDMT